MDLNAIREAAEELSGAARYVEGACPTGMAVIEHMRDKILRLLDEADNDNTTTLTRDVCYDHGEITNYGAYQCDKCGAKQPDRYPYCPGCGRRIKRGDRG